MEIWEKNGKNLLTKSIYTEYNGTTIAKEGNMKSIYGTIEIQADERGRIRIPSTYRAALGDTQVFGFKNKKGCYLRIFGAEMLDALTQGYSGKVTLEESRASINAREIFRHVIRLEEDKQGRFTLPQKLRDSLRISRELVFVGMGNTLELWSKEVYDEYEAEQDRLADEEAQDDEDDISSFKF